MVVEALSAVASGDLREEHAKAKKMRRQESLDNDTVVPAIL